MGQDGKAVGFLIQAKDLRDSYMKRIEGQEDRIGLPKLQLMREAVLREMLSNESMLPEEFRERLRAVAVSE